MQYCDYCFVQIGQFVKASQALDIQLDGKPDRVTVELILNKAQYRQLGESVYLVTVNGQV